MSASDEKYSSADSPRPMNGANHDNNRNDLPASPSLQRAMNVVHNDSSSPYAPPPPSDDVPTLGVPQWPRQTCPFCGYRPVAPGATCPSCYRPIPLRAARQLPWRFIALGALALIVVAAASFFAARLSSAHPIGNVAHATPTATAPRATGTTTASATVTTAPQPTVVIGAPTAIITHPTPTVAPPTPKPGSSDCTTNVSWLNEPQYNNTIQSTYNYTIVPQGLFDNSSHHFCYQFRTATILWIPNATLDAGTATLESYVQQSDGSITTKVNSIPIQKYAAGEVPTLFGDAIGGNCAFSYFDVHSSNTGFDSSSRSPYQSPTNSSFDGYPSWCP